MTFNTELYEERKKDKRVKRGQLLLGNCCKHRKRKQGTQKAS